MDMILAHIQHKFATFGNESGKKQFTNPVADAFKTKPLMFATGVDVYDVITLILTQFGFLDSMEAVAKVCKWAEEIDDDDLSEEDLEFVLPARQAMEIYVLNLKLYEESRDAAKLVQDKETISKTNCETE